MTAHREKLGLAIDHDADRAVMSPVGAAMELHLLVPGL